jgi:hypothetical protein
MKEDENILEKAVRSLKNEQTPPGPPNELVEETIEKLNQVHEQPINIEFVKRDRITMLSSLVKFAAAAVFLIIAGFAAGRLTMARPSDIEQIRASLEPAIRNQLLGEMKQYVQANMANSYIQIKDDLTEQYRRDMNQLAANIVTASGTMTNQLLEQLIESVDAAQTQDRQRFIAALEQIELNRRRDNAQLSNALVSFAVQTDDRLTQTQQDMEQLWSYTQSDNLLLNEFQNQNNPN